MIMKFILDILITILTFIMGIISNAMPDIEVIRYYKDFLQIVSAVLQTAVNFIYFTIGEAMFPLLTIGSLMLTYRYIIFPVVVIARRLIIKGGDE